MGKLHLITGDIIADSDGMDAIVNSQNKYMSYGSGVCGAIYRAAGNNLLQHCIDTYSSEMEMGEVRITPGFDLKMDILHILVPKEYEEKENALEKLIYCYENLLNEILKHNYKKIIIPSLGCGVHGYKHEVIANSIMLLLNNFCNTNNVELYFINKYPLITDIYLKELLDIKEINLKKVFNNSNINDCLSFLYDKGLNNFDVVNKYKEFVKGRDLKDLGLTEKLICMQYTIENFGISKDQIKPIIESL